MNLHPALSAFPVALLILTALCEVFNLIKQRVFLNQFCNFALGLAIPFVGLTFLTGYNASELANQSFIVPDQAISEHHSFGRLLLFFIAPTFALRIISGKAEYCRTAFRITYYAFLLASIYLVIVTDMHGANLIFQHGAGVRLEP